MQLIALLLVQTMVSGSIRLGSGIQRVRVGNNMFCPQGKVSGALEDPFPWAQVRRVRVGNNRFRPSGIFVRGIGGSVLLSGRVQKTGVRIHTLGLKSKGLSGEHSKYVLLGGHVRRTRTT